MNTDSKETTPVIGVGLMAYGMSGKVFHAPFFDAHTGFQLAAVVERTQKRAAADYPAIKSYDNLEAMLAADSIDLVVVNTPNNRHFEHTIMALDAGKHVLLEKPACATTAQLEQMLRKAADAGRSIFFYQNRRWDSDFLAVKQVVESGALGKLNEVHFRFDRYRAGISVKAFKEEPVEASGLLYDLGPHLLDQVISLWGRPQHWNIVKGKNRPDTKVDDYFSIHLAYEDSLNVFVHSNMMTVAPQPAYVVHGSKGTFVKKRTDVQEDQLAARIKPNDSNYGVEAAGQEGYLYLLKDGAVQTEKVTALKGDYRLLFEAVYNAIAKGEAYPVSDADITTQLTIIESAS